MKKKIMAICAAGILIVCAVAFAAEPGSSDDPLISKSYIENVLMPQIYSYIDNALSSINSNGSGAESSKFEVVNVRAGQEVIGGAGTEMILRMGSGSIIGSLRGGVADTTAGIDIAGGENMPANHLLIVPLGDGRGVKISDFGDAILMIKGSYEIR